MGEHQIIQHLSKEGLFDHLLGLSHSLALFKKHFLTMSGLYSLQKSLQNSFQYKLNGTPQGLFISPLSIELFDLNTDSEQARAVGLESPKIAEYYLDDSNLAAATEETVDELMRSFWTKFAQWSTGGDAFGVLGLAESATWDEVKKTYRQKVQQEHPDKGGSADKFTEYSDAYQQLKIHFGH